MIIIGLIGLGVSVLLAACIASFAMSERDPPVTVERITAVNNATGKPVYTVESGRKET